MTSPLCEQTHPLTLICRRFSIISPRTRAGLEALSENTRCARFRPPRHRYLEPAVIASTASEQT